VEDGHAGEGNIDEDPLFIGAGEHPHALAPGSPCVDAGSPDTLGLRLPEFDLAGRERVAGGRVDMGAYEGADGTGVEEEPGDQDPLGAATLVRSRPNPFRGGATVTLAVPVSSAISVVVYDVAGRKVRTLLDGRIDAGEHEIPWDGEDDRGRAVASGVYLLRAEPANGPPARAKLVLIR